MEFIKKYLKQFIITFIILILLLCAWNIAVFIDGILNRHENEETEEVPETKRISKTFEYDGSDSVFQPVSKIYDDRNLLERQIEYLDENYDEYEEVIDDIVAISDDVFDGLTSDYDRYAELSDTVDCGKPHTFDIGLRNKEFLDYGYFHISGMLYVIGLFDDTRVIYAYDYPNNEKKEIVVVDYKDIGANTEKPEVIDFGDEHSFYGNTDYVDIREIDGFMVMFSK